MATDTGLFGPTPWEVQQAQNQQVNDYAANFARMSPFEKAGMLMGKAGAGITGAVAPMLGGVNVPQQQAAQNQQALQGADLQTPEGLRAAAKKMLDIGNQKAAYALAQKAAEVEKEQADIALKNAQAKKALAYQPAGYGNTKEYQDQVDIITDPESTPEEVQYAKERIAALNAKATGRGASATSQFKTGEDGNVYLMNKVTGDTKIVTKPDGTPLKAADASPELKAKMAESSAVGKAIGTASSGATIDLIDAVPMAEIQMRQLDQLINHPGLSGAVGVGIPKALQAVGTKEADFAARFEQIKGGVFLQAFKSLRGGGQITDVEGNKATAALLRAQTTQSETEFKDAIREYMGYIKVGLDRLKQKAALTTTPQTQSTPAQVSAAPIPTGDHPNFSGLNTPQEVKAAYKDKRIDKTQANAILDDMKSRGLF